MTDLRRYLQSKPWWASRFMWGLEATRLLVVDAVWHSRFTMNELDELDEDAFA